MPLPFDHISRRTILARSAGIFGLIMSGLFTHTSLAALLTKPTPGQSLGPFFPDDGDEVDAIRENPDSNLPISQANDQDLTFVKGRKGTALGQVIYLRGQILNAKTGSPFPMPCLSCGALRLQDDTTIQVTMASTVSLIPKPGK